jgi:transposase-like protein
MRKSRFTEEQIALALRQVDAGVPIAELCRKLGISEPTFYSWDEEVRRDGAEETLESFFCRFGIGPEYRPALEEKGLRVTSFDLQGEPRVLELLGHPFFLATLYVP